MKPCPLCGIDMDVWGKLHTCRPKKISTKKVPEEVIPVILEDAAKHEAMKAELRKDAREGKMLPDDKPAEPGDGVALGFDRVKYQREYMRKWRRRKRDVK